MKINNKLVKKFQVGGSVPAGEPMPAEGGAPMGPEGAAPAEGGAPGGEEEMMAQLQQIATEILNQMGPEAAMALAQMIMDMAQGGAAAPAPAPQPAMQRQGGRLKRLW